MLLFSVVFVCSVQLTVHVWSLSVPIAVLAAAAAGMKGMMWDFIWKLFSLEIPTLRSLPLSLSLSCPIRNWRKIFALILTLHPPPPPHTDRTSASCSRRKIVRKQHSWTLRRHWLQQGVTKRCRLFWPIATSYSMWAQMRGGKGGGRGLCQWVQLCTWSPNKLWKSPPLRTSAREYT